MGVTDPFEAKSADKLAALLAADQSPPPPATDGIVAQATRAQQDRPWIAAHWSTPARAAWAAGAAAAVVLGCVTGIVSRTAPLPPDVEMILGSASIDVGGAVRDR